MNSEEARELVAAARRTRKAFEPGPGYYDLDALNKRAEDRMAVFNERAKHRLEKAIRAEIEAASRAGGVGFQADTFHTHPTFRWCLPDRDGWEEIAASLRADGFGVHETIWPAGEGLSHLGELPYTRGTATITWMVAPRKIPTTAYVRNAGEPFRRPDGTPIGTPSAASV